MKRTILAAILFTVLSSACHKQLEQDPITEKELGNFLRTEKEVEEYVNATYATLQATGLYKLYLPALAEIASDNSYDEVPANDGGMYGDIDQFRVVPANGILSTTWRQSYQGIQRATVVLSRIGNVTFTSPAVKQSRIGEMKFIRALLYFNLVRLWGDVPLVTTETSDPNLYFGQGRAPLQQVYEQIVKDLESAAIDLEQAPAIPGRVSRTAAQTLLGKVFLTQGMYDKARTALQEVYLSKKHQLFNDVKKLFALENENNPEIIFSVEFTSGINGNTEGSDMYQQFSPSGTVSGAKGHNLPTKTLYALYAADDLRKDAYVKVTTNGIPYNNKLVKPTTIITDGGSNFVVLRYADVLLMLAETENELGNTSSAIKYLDEVRARAGLKGTDAATQLTLRREIAVERQRELVGEGHRWFDLLRTGEAIAVMNRWFTSQGILITIGKTNLLMPVPQNQIDTDPSIRQNEGYN